MVRQPPIGTAGTQVLLKLAALPRDTCWSREDGTALYESRALTDAVCQRLVQSGYLTETLKGTLSVYSINKAGRQKALEITMGVQDN
jgi:hypothetical protein